VLDDGTDDISVHSKWALIGKVLSPSTLHISTIAAALRPAWGNPRGLLLNPTGVNIFVAEFGTKADMDRVLDGSPWVVGKRAVLLQGFDADLKPQEMTFNKLRLWVRIVNPPFGYMHQKWGKAIGSSFSSDGCVPVVDCAADGRCWGSYMRVRVEVDVDKPLRRGVTVFSQRRQTTDWFSLQYEDLPHYCFSCGFIGHTSTECNDPGERDAEGKLPYSADRLCAPDEKKKKNQAARSSSGSVSAGQGRSSTPVREGPSQSRNTSGAANKSQVNEAFVEVSSPTKNVKIHARAKQTKADTSQAKGKDLAQDGKMLTGQKRKNQQVYRPRAPSMLTAEVVNPLAVVVHQAVDDHVIEEEHTEDNIM
jgi:hypothetical protein